MGMVGDLIEGLWGEGWTLTVTRFPAMVGHPRFKITATNGDLDPATVFEGSGGTRAEAIVDLVGKITDHAKTVAGAFLQKYGGESCGAR